MQKYRIVEQLPTAKEYNALRASADWGLFEDGFIEKSISNSLYCLCVFDDTKIIGMVRVVGDNGLCFYIQDLIILPEYQHKGIGSQLIQKVLAYIKSHASHSSVIALLSSYGKEAFYEKFGFVKRPNEFSGSGMSISFEQLGGK